MVKVVGSTAVISIGILEFTKVVEGVDLFQGDLYYRRRDSNSSVKYSVMIDEQARHTLKCSFKYCKF